VPPSSAATTMLDSLISPTDGVVKLVILGKAVDMRSDVLTGSWQSSADG
jgi:hypothetical protein